MISMPLIYFRHFCKGDEHDQPTNWLFMPETKDLSLEEVRYFFTQKSIVSQTSKVDKDDIIAVG